MASIFRVKRMEWILVLVLLGARAAAAGALEDIHVVALFKDRAVVIIDGQQHLLRSGGLSPEGVKLVSADSAGAVFEYRGRTLKRRLDGRVRAQTASPRGQDNVRIFRDSRGMFRTVGSINGLPVTFLVDTGASSLAMNSAQARRLGIDFRVRGQPTYVSTASDIIQAFQVKLDVVKVGTIEMRNVTAVVMEGAQPRDVLLGMSFLGRVEMVNTRDQLLLRKKY